MCAADIVFEYIYIYIYIFKHDVSCTQFMLLIKKKEKIYMCVCVCVCVSSSWRDISFLPILSLIRSSLRMHCLKSGLNEFKKALYFSQVLFRFMRRLKRIRYKISRNEVSVQFNQASLKILQLYIYIYIYTCVNSC